MGGTGKTPLLIKLANDLKNSDRRPAILTRGYGDDEISLMKEKCAGVPVVAGADRAAGARALLGEGDPGVFLLDDGFQHWPLKRNLDIVCIDAAAPFEEESLLPAGRLREPLSALSRARVAVITRSEMVSSERLAALKRDIRSRMPSGVVFASRFEKRLVEGKTGEEVLWTALQHGAVIALSAVGNPAAFESDLINRGVKITPLRFRDHHAYSEREIEKIKKLAAEMGARVVTTEKDWVKLKKWPLDALVVTLSTSFAKEDEVAWNQEIRKAVA